MSKLKKTQKRIGFNPEVGKRKPSKEQLFCEFMADNEMKYDNFDEFVIDIEAVTMDRIDGWFYMDVTHIDLYDPELLK